jgi:hypothetical protein
MNNIVFARTAVAAALALAAGLATAATQVYSFNLDGLQEVPANASPAAGSMQITIDDVAGLISYSFAGFNLQGSFSAAHIHVAPAGVNGPVVFNLVPPADYSGPVTFGNISIPNSWALLGQSETISTTLAAAINATPWNYYVNIHTSLFPGGEIRGQLAPIPEPGTWALMAGGLGLIGWRLRQRRAA